MANKLRLLRFDATEREAIPMANTSAMRAILRLPQEARMSAIEHVIKNGLNVSRTEAYTERDCDENYLPDGKRGKRKLILKDIRILFNTIDRAIETVIDAGIKVTKQKKEFPDAIEILIRVPK